MIRSTKPWRNVVKRLVIKIPILMYSMGTKCDTDSLLGLPCTYTLEHPDMRLVVDKVGSNLSQKGNGHIGGTKYMCEKGTD